jgi:hypothetical protein
MTCKRCHADIPPNLRRCPRCGVAWPTTPHRTLFFDSATPVKPPISGCAKNVACPYFYGLSILDDASAAAIAGR